MRLDSPSVRHLASDLFGLLMTGTLCKKLFFLTLGLQFRLGYIGLSSPAGLEPPRGFRKGKITPRPLIL